MKIGWLAVAIAAVALVAADPALARKRHKPRAATAMRRRALSVHLGRPVVQRPPATERLRAGGAINTDEYIGQDPDPNIRFQLQRDPTTGYIGTADQVALRTPARCRTRPPLPAPASSPKPATAPARRWRWRRSGGRARSCPRARGAWSSGHARCRDRRRSTSPSPSVRFQNARSLSVPRRNDSTTGSVILPSRKSSPTFLPSLADLPP